MRISEIVISTKHLLVRYILFVKCTDLEYIWPSNPYKMKRLSIFLTLVLVAVSVIGQTPNTNLAGRSVVGNLPRPIYNVQKEGVVVVAITVDQYGKVTQAVPGADGTTVTDQSLWAAARKAAMESHFNQSNDPTPTQGTITYNFINKD